jgi:sugar lactone lactonase YvrE
MRESPRWHSDRLWFSDWGAQQIIAVDVAGNSEVIVCTQFGLPFCFDWLLDGRLLIESGRENLLMRQKPDESLVIHADLRSVSNQWCNEIVVDGRGNAYINFVVRADWNADCAPGTTSGDSSSARVVTKR